MSSHSHSHVPNPNPFITKAPFSSPSKPLPLSQGILLTSSSDPLAPLELRLVSLLSYPCTAIVNPVSQSSSAYPLVHAKNSNSMTGISNSGLAKSPARMGINFRIGIETPQISLPGLIDKSAGEDLAKWREQNWKEGLNAGGCGVSGSFGLGGSEGKEKQEDDERPKYIIHTHAPNFADKSYSTPLVKQLLVNCYRGALVEAMGIAEREEEGGSVVVVEGKEDDSTADGKGKEKIEEVKEKAEEMEEESAKDTKGKEIDGNAIFLESTENDANMRDTDTDTNENIIAKRGMTPEIPRKIGLRNFGTVNMAGSMSCPASLESPRDAIVDTSSISPIPSPSILPSKSIPPTISIPSILLPSSTSAPSPFHDSSKQHIPQSSPRPRGITVAFPAISTGHKSFPHRLAARIAVGTVKDFLRHPIFGAIRRKRIRKVVFCVWPVDSPNGKSLQVAFGLNFPSPLPQSAPLSPVSNQLSTPPFSPSVRGRRAFDFKLGLALRDFEGEASVGDVPRIVVTPPVALDLASGKKERERDSSSLGSSEEKRLSRDDGDSEDEGIERVENTDMNMEKEREVEVESEIKTEVEIETEEGDGDLRGEGNESVEDMEKDVGIVKEMNMEVEVDIETEVGDGVGRNLTARCGQKNDEVQKKEKPIQKEKIRKAEIEKGYRRGDSSGRDRRGRKETYRQRKRQQGLRLAAAMRLKRVREKERGIEEVERYLNLLERLRVGKKDTRTPEITPGTVEGKTERSEDGRTGEEEVDPMKVTDEGARRPEVRGDTCSPESILSIEERRAERSQSKDKETQENQTVGRYIRRHGGIETRNKQERGYPERKEVRDTKAGTKRGRPSKTEERRTEGSDTERHGGRKKRK